MAVVALTRVQRVEEPSRASGQASFAAAAAVAAPRRRELHAACLCLDEPVRHIR